jgi:acyl dehydratase
MSRTAYGGGVETSWSIRARNLPDHANNPIHTDVGARAAGFERALVAGVTSYAYCLHPVLESYGLEFAAHGEAEVRFRSPVFDGDELTFPTTAVSAGLSGLSGLSVNAVAARVDKPLLSVNAWNQHRPSHIASGASEVSGSMQSDEQLETVVLRLTGEYSSHYAERAGDDFSMQGFVHPAVWPALANYVFHRQLARGSWIHTRSVVKHHALVRDGVEATIHTTVRERFERGGERVIADVVISTADAGVVATVEHEAIVDLSVR